MLRPAPKPDSRALAFIFVTVLLSIIGLGIIIPVMPTLIQELTGAEVGKAAELGGYLLAVYAVMQFFMSPILGALADRFGRRRVILTSLFAYAVDFALMAWAPTFAWLFIGRMLSGASAATYSAANAYIADVSPPEKRAANFGLLGAAFGLGFIIGPALGGWLGEHGTRLPFIAASAVVFVNFVFGYFVLPETLTDENRRRFEWSRANPIGGLLSVARNKLVLGVLFAYFLMMLAHQALPTIWAYFAEAKYGWGPRHVGFSLAYVGITAAFVQGYLTRKLIPRLGETRAAILGLVSMAASLLGFALFAPVGWMIYFWMTVGAFQGFTQPSLQGILSRATPANQQGELQGAIASVMSLTMITGPLVMTQIFFRFTREGGDIYFPGAPFVVSSVIIFVSVIPLALTMRKIPSQTETKADGPEDSETTEAVTEEPAPLK